MYRLSSWKVASSLFAAAAIIFLGMAQYAMSAQKPGTPEITAKYKQSAEEQQRDISECYEIAKSRTGINPEDLTASAATEAPSNPRSAGTSTATSTPPEADSKASAEANRAANQSSSGNQQLDTFRAANEACLRARGYVVHSSKETPK